MRILLDTHCWLWMLGDPDRSAPESRDLLEDSRNELFLAAASSWEIAIKYALGPLELPEPPIEYVPDRMLASGVTGLPVEHRHTLMVATMELHHRDPFDCLLVGQAILEEMSLLTADPQLGRSGAELIRA